MTPYFESVIEFDPDGIRRIYASTWIEARQEARNYIRNRPETAPLAAWRFESWRENDNDVPYRRGQDLGSSAEIFFWPPTR